jgi:hypothetical protein
MRCWKCEEGVRGDRRRIVAVPTIQGRSSPVLVYRRRLRIR